MSLVATALAQQPDSNIVQSLGQISAVGGISINNIFDWALGIGGVVALGIIIFGGVMYIASAGSSSRQGEAKEWIRAAIYGLILLAVGYLILNTINPAILGR
jgi:hypothetical protein